MSPEENLHNSKVLLSGTSTEVILCKCKSIAYIKAQYLIKLCVHAYIYTYTKPQKVISFPHFDFFLKNYTKFLQIIPKLLLY